MKKNTEDGRWVTLDNGTHLFIKTGQTLDEAISTLDKGNKNDIKKTKSNTKTDYEDDDLDFESWEKDSEGEELSDFDNDYDKWSNWAEKTDKEVPQDWKPDGWDGDTRFYSVDKNGISSVSINPNGYVQVYTENGSLNFNNLEDAKNLVENKSEDAIKNYFKNNGGSLGVIEEKAIDDILGSGKAEKIFNNFDKNDDEKSNNKTINAEQKDNNQTKNNKKPMSFEEAKKLIKSQFGTDLDEKTYKAILGLNK